MNPIKSQHPKRKLGVKRAHGFAMTTIIEKAMIDHGRISVADLARKIGRSRVAVSQAINNGRFRPTLNLILEELGI